MLRLLIIATNCTLLALLLIGLPAATHAQLGNWQITSAVTSRHLLFCGLILGIAGNILADYAVAKGRKGKILCREWTAIFTGLLLIFWGFTRGYFSFAWLRNALLWLQSHL